MISILDVNVNDSTLWTILVVLGIIALALFIISWFLGRPWRP